MAYREDLDAFAQQRARDDDEAALLASFRRGERSRRKRALATWLAGLAAVCAIYGGALGAPARRHHARLMPAALRHDPIADAAAAQRRACARQAVHDYREWLGGLEDNVAGDPGPHYTLNDFARSCTPSVPGLFDNLPLTLFGPSVIDGEAATAFNPDPAEALAQGMR